MLGLKPIKLLPARERVASALRKAIIAQQIKEGETLTLETTAQQLGVSITPVREAFQILERDGLISLQQNRGATVLGINEKTLREHYQVRAVLEKAACELCCENGADLSSVKNCIDTAEEALERNDVTDYANQNQSIVWKLLTSITQEKTWERELPPYSGILCRTVINVRFTPIWQAAAAPFRERPWC